MTKYSTLFAFAAVAAAVILLLVTGDAEAGGCRHGGAPWDWTCWR